MSKSKTRKPYKRRRRDPNFQAIPFSVSLALGALLDDIIVKTNLLNNAFDEDFYIISIDWVAQIVGHTTGEGPIPIGLSHGDLTVAEIAESLDAEITDPDNIIARERSRRPVRRMGTFPGQLAEEVINNGVEQRIPIRWIQGNDTGINIWGRNQTDATLTTGTLVKAQGTMFGRWKR